MDRSEEEEVKLDEVDEKHASGEVEEVYQRIRDTLQAGIVSSPWRAFATKPKFLEAAWRELEPAVDEGFMEIADAIRAMTIFRVRESLPVPDHRAELGAHLARAAEELRVFLEVDPKVLILLCALRHAWKGQPIGGYRQASPSKRGVPEWHPKIHLASARVGKAKEVLQEITDTLGLPEPALEYRALATYPDFLEAAWQDLKAYVGTEAWRAACISVEWVAEQAAVALPSQVSLSPDQAGDLALEKDDVEEIRHWIEVFHDTLPGLIVNNSYLHVSMYGGVELMEAPPPPEVTGERRERSDPESGEVRSA